MLRYKILLIFFIFFTAVIFLTGCTSSKNDKDDADTVSIKTEPKTDKESGDMIIKTALEEQKNEMYKVDADSTTLYWLDNKVVHFSRTSKCNIFALNTLHKAGFITPVFNTLSRDLFNDTLFTEIMPVIKINGTEDISKGDLVIWKYHVIIFEKPIYTKNAVYAFGIWAGTSQEDNGTNIQNNVIYGKYPLKGDFIVRRPIKRKSR